MLRDRRHLLKLLVTTPAWTVPVVQSVTLPAHADVSGIPCTPIAVPPFTTSVDCGSFEEQRSHYRVVPGEGSCSLQALGPTLDSPQNGDIQVILFRSDSTEPRDVVNLAVWTESVFQSNGSQVNIPCGAGTSNVASNPTPIQGILTSMPVTIANGVFTPGNLEVILVSTDAFD